MPTFRQDVKLGTMVPLVGGSDISDGAITKDKLYKGLVKDIMEEAKLLNKSKKKKQQIIIGKAIRVKSCDIGAVENWYVQLYSAILYYRNDNIDSAEKIHLKAYKKYHEDGEEGYEEAVCSIDNMLTRVETGPFVWNLSVGSNRMFRVDRYEEVEQDDGTISLSVWLSHKELPPRPTIKDISSRYEIINGRRVLRSKKDILSRFYVQDEKLVVDLHNFNLYKSRTCVKNKRYRYNYWNIAHDMSVSPETLHKKRWRKIFDLNLGSKNIAGRYKLVVKDKKSNCKQVEYFYIKRERLNKYVIQKNGI